MITESTPTQDLLAMLANARPLGEVSFEEGCAVLDAVEMFDRRDAGGKLGTWLEYSAAGSNALRFAPATDACPNPAHRLVCERLVQDVVAWTGRQRDRAMLAVSSSFTAWIVIDRATRTTWVECSPIQNRGAMHPRAIREAGEFPSSFRGTVSIYTFVRMDATWREVLDSVQEAYHEALLEDHLQGVGDEVQDALELDRADVGAVGAEPVLHHRALPALGPGQERGQRHDQREHEEQPLDRGEEKAAIKNPSPAQNAMSPDLHVTNGAVGIRTSQLAEPVRLRTLTVSGAGSVGIDLDDGSSK